MAVQAYVKAPKPYAVGSDFSLWVKRFESYAKAVKVADEQISDALLSLLDDSAFRAFDLLGLTEEQVRDYKQLVGALKKRFAPTTGEAELRFQFGQRCQKPSESFDEFVDAIVDLVNRAYPEMEAGTRMNLVRDRLIAGVRADFIQERLLQQAPVSLDEARRIAKELYAARAARKRMQTSATEIYNLSTSSDQEEIKPSGVAVNIDTGSAAPIKQMPRRLPLHKKQVVGKLISEMQSQGIIQPSKSPWASPIVLVEKKNGSIRFCIDYRKLNKETKKDSYPLPRVDDLLDDLADAKWFSTIDLASGYWQVEVSPEDQEKTAFTTPHGLYQFKVMPFGLCNAPSTFQRLMELVLAGLRWDTCLAYLDDIIVFGRTFPEHLADFRKSVTFLGHKVSHEGISTDPEKTNSIRNWPIPTDTHELKSFLGLASYYRRFIPNFAEITAPMAQLTQKKEIVWTEECIRSFETIKKKLTNAPVLGFPSLKNST